MLPEKEVAAPAASVSGDPVFVSIETSRSKWVVAGHRVLVIDPASLLVNRRAKRAKADRIDAKSMVRALMAFNRGEHQVLSAVRVPTVDEIRRELAHLQLVTDQLASVEAERDRVALAKQPTEDAVCSDDAMIAALARIRGVGSNDASVLVREAFWARVQKPARDRGMERLRTNALGKRVQSAGIRASPRPAQHPSGGT